MEAKGIAVWQLGIGDGARGGSRPAEAGYRKRMSLRLRLRHHRRGDVQEPGQAGLVGRTGNTRQSPLSIISQACILGARVRKDACLPREICTVSIRTERTVRGDHRTAEVSSVSWRSSKSEDWRAY